MTTTVKKRKFSYLVPCREPIVGRGLRFRVATKRHVGTMEEFRELVDNFNKDYVLNITLNYEDNDSVLRWCREYGAPKIPSRK